MGADSRPDSHCFDPLMPAALHVPFGGSERRGPEWCNRIPGLSFNVQRFG